MVNNDTDIAAKEVLAGLRAALDPDPERAAEKHDLLRRKLVSFFEWSGAISPDECADETLIAAAWRMTDVKAVQSVLSGFAAIARSVLDKHEQGRRERPGTPDVAPRPPEPNGNEDAEDRRLIGYLLGQLSETKQTQLEDRYFADDALFEELAVAETELIDAYARGELPDPDRAHFKKRFLGSTRLRARIALARQLHSKTLPAVGTSAPTMSRQKTQPLRASRLAPALIGAVSAVVVVFSAVVGWWTLQSTSPRAAAAGESDPARPAVQSVAPPLPAAQGLPTADRHTTSSVPIALVLAPGSIQGSEGRAVLTMPQGTDDVRIQIDHAGAARERYAVAVGTGERHSVWTELNLTPRAPGAKGVIVEIPVSFLPPGDYILTLSGAAVGVRRLEAVADYSFRVR